LKFEFKFAVDGFVLSTPPPFESAVVGLRTVAAGGHSRERGADNYAAAALGKNLISTGWVQRMSIADNQCLYGGCVIGLLPLAGWRKEPGSSKLRFGPFWGEFVVF
jgi:hypothetical protein